jgi:hypothetical protein
VAGLSPGHLDADGRAAGHRDASRRARPGGSDGPDRHDVLVLDGALVTDLGLPEPGQGLAVVVASAALHDNVFGTRLLDKVAAKTPTVTKALVDQGFKSSVVEHGAALGIGVEIVQRNPEQTGFVPQPIRWRVEQTNGTLLLQRRLTREYDVNEASSESRVYWAITAIMARRLTGETTPTWRGA